MNELIKLALALVDGGMLRHGQRSGGQLVCVVVAILSATVCAMAALACVLSALWIYALPHVGAVAAPVVVAGVLLVLCLTILALMRYAPKPHHAPISLVGATPEFLLTEATRLLKEHKIPVLIAALLAGVIAGKNEK